MANESADAPTDFFAGLTADHALIETRLAALEQAARTISAQEGDAAALSVITDTLRFFASEGAQHEADEEITLFPRLQLLPEFRQIVSALEFQHRMNAGEGEALAACVARFAPGKGRELLRQAIRFVEAHRGHAVAEERALFPLAAARLSPAILADLARERQKRQQRALRSTRGA
jgi:hemerythrin-like domain-containing protein